MIPHPPSHDALGAGSALPGVDAVVPKVPDDLLERVATLLPGWKFRRNHLGHKWWSLDGHLYFAPSHGGHSYACDLSFDAGSAPLPTMRERHQLLGQLIEAADLLMHWEIHRPPEPERHGPPTPVNEISKPAWTSPTPSAPGG